MIHLIPILMAALQASGPVGTKIPVASSIIDGGNYETTWDHGIAWSSSGDRYLSVSSHKTSHKGQAVLINAATGVAGAPITLPGGYVTSPAVAWSPARQCFLVAYVDGPFSTPSPIVAVVLDAAGSPVGSAMANLINSDEYGAKLSSEVRVACDGDGWLVTWTGYDFEDDGYAIRGRVVGGASTNAAPVFATDPFDIRRRVSNTRQTDVAFSSGSYLVAWDNEFVTEGCTVSPDGALGALQTYGPEFVMPVLAASATPGEFILSSSAPIYSVNTGSPAVQRIGPDGAPIGAATILGSNALQGTVTSVWNSAAEQYLAAWFEDDGSGTFQVRAVQLNADLSPIASSLIVATGVYAGTQLYATIAVASRSSGTQVILQWDEDGGGSFPLKAQRYDLGQHPGKPVISGLVQVQSDDSAAIEVGGRARWAGISARATLSNFAGDPMTLQVEVRPEGRPFTGTPTAAGDVTASGSVAIIEIDLAPGSGYRWQARGVSVKGKTSAWLAFGSVPDDIDEVDVEVPADATHYTPPQLGSSGVTQVCSGSAAGLMSASLVAFLLGLVAIRRQA